MDSAPRPLPPAFEIVRPLGAGAFGDVVLARQRSLGRLVAVKRIHSFVLGDTDAVERFRREAVVLARLQSPVIIRVYDFTIDDRGGLLVMEYVDGAALDDYFAPGAVSTAAALRILGDVAEALDTAARAGIAHRDVKPANVIVARAGRAKLGDFGLARITTDPAVFRTAGPGVAGTPAYLPPEVAQGQEPDPRADVYSFAVMAFELLTGRRPYTADNPMALVAAHWQRPVPRADDVRPGFPVAGADALERAMAKNPDVRAGLGELMAALRSVPPDQWPNPLPAERADQPRGSTRLMPPAARPHVADQPRPASGPLSRRRPRSRRRAAALVVAVTGLVAAGVAILVVRATRPQPHIEIASVTLAVSAPTGRCPLLRYVVSGQIRTNGAAGRLRVTFTGPVRPAPPAQVVDVPSSQRTVPVHSPITVTGENDLNSTVQVAVATAAHTVRARAALVYRC